MLGWQLVTAQFAPPRPKPAREVAEMEDGEAGAEKKDDKPAAGEDGAANGDKPPAPSEEGDAGDPPDGNNDRPEDGDKPEAGEAEADTALDQTPRWFTLGSLDRADGYELLVTVASRGAAVENATLSSEQFTSVREYGYLGALPVTPLERGLRIEAVGPGTPAARAVCIVGGAAAGLQGGDILLAIDDVPIVSKLELLERIKQSRPGDKLRIDVGRVENGETRALTFEATLTGRPMELISQEYAAREDSCEPLAPAIPLQPHPGSFLLALQQLNDRKVSVSEDEIAGAVSLREAVWQVEEEGFATARDGAAQRIRESIALSMLLTADLKRQVSDPAKAAFKIIKRYRLATAASRGADPPPALSGASARGFHLDYEIEIRNLSQEAANIAYRQDGPAGLPLEGWWYQWKIHPKLFHGAGVRDVIYATGGGSMHVESAASIADDAGDEPSGPGTPLFGAEDGKPMRYLGVDTQYFSVVMTPHPKEEPSAYLFDAAWGIPAAGINPNLDKLTDVTFRLISKTQLIPPGGSLKQRFRIFAGPKEPAVLAEYGLEDTIVYGWFAPVVKIMLWLLHFFHDYLTFGNFGLAIILLTVLVRGAMHPLSRKQALSAQKMQELQPEIKKIAEMYKNDMEKRSKAQQELFKKHNYNPFGSCLVLFLQLPIFIGLYRSLSVDIALRQAPLIPGMRWCGDLAAPDMLFYFKDFLPCFIAGPNGYLGPYFNLLPLLTIVVFQVQQRMFMPPPADEQQKMQQQMMSFMMLFIGVLFWKVAAGLCVYFLASSLWGIAEKQLLPKPKKDGRGDPTPRHQQADAGRKRRRATKKKRK